MRQQALAEVSSLSVEPQGRVIRHADLQDNPRGPPVSQALFGSLHEMVADALPPEIRVHIQSHDVTDERLFLIGKHERGRSLVGLRDEGERAALEKGEGNILRSVRNRFRKTQPVQSANRSKVLGPIFPDVKGSLLTR